MTEAEIRKLAESEFNEYITHIKTGRIYRVIGKGMFKFDGEWHHSIMYCHDGDDIFYCRKLDDFNGFEETTD